MRGSMNPKEYLNLVTSIQIQAPEIKSDLIFQSLSSEGSPSILSFSSSLLPYHFEYLGKDPLMFGQEL